jgi:hypothetical protein
MPASIGRVLARWAAPLLALGLLLGAAQSVQSRRPAEATEYFERVRNASRNLPRIIGDWYGKEVPAAAPALKLLKPNFMVSRMYQNLRTGRSVQVVIVQSLDAYDMVYHYPPNCFRHNGWTKQWQEQRRWHIGDRPLALMEYGFTRTRFSGEENTIVANFIILATGFALDMGAIESAALDPAQRPFGAAQVQVIFDATLSEQERREAFEAITREHLSLFHEMTDPRHALKP